MDTQTLRFLSWNIDMDTPPVSTRTRSLVRHIRRLQPHVVLLQEVTAVSYPILVALLNPPPSPLSPPGDAPWPPTHAKQVDDSPVFDVHIDATWPEVLPYFPLLLTRRALLRDVKSRAERFPASRMHRGFVEVCGELGNGARVAFLTSHLESLKEGAVQRKEQLLQIFDRQRELRGQGTASVFAGDTNLREAEVSAKEVYKTAAAEKKRREEERGERPKKRRRGGGKGGGGGEGVLKLVDAWLAGGGSEEERFTWDMKANDNLDMEGDFKPRARYDRAFLMASEEVEVDVERFELVGKERLSCGKFVSDHWGVCVDVQFNSKHKKEG